ncbi:MAG: hypothetical protein IH987_06530 [Planctomycetes bacterium]|nr:hypothetical protein [Planctomycetota bacterium]
MNWNARTNIKRALVAFVIGLTAFVFVLREPTEQLTIESLASAQQRWRLAKIADYDFQYRMHGSEYAVRCRGGAVIEAKVNGKPAMSQDLSNYGVEGLFDILELDLENLGDPNGPFGGPAQQVIVRVRFHGEFGYIERYIRSGGRVRAGAIELISFRSGPSLFGDSSSSKTMN